MTLSAKHIDRARQANALLNAGHARDALRTVEALLRKAPPHPALFNLAGLCARASGDGRKAESYLRRAIALQDDHALAHNNLGLVLADAGRLDEAVREFERALAIAPDDPGTLINLGNALRAAKRVTEAESAYRRALDRDPENADAFYNLGLLMAGCERPDAAEAAFRQALAIRPGQADAWNDLGNVLADTLDLDAAQAAYRQAIRLDPRHADAYCNLGMLLLEKGDAKAARDAFRQALAIDPGHAVALNSLANQLSHARQFDKAEAAYRAALQRHPDAATVYNNLGSLLRENDRYAEAEAAYRKALALEPDYGHALGQAVNCARMRYDWSNAAADEDAIRAALAAGITGIPAFTVLSLPSLGPLEQRRAAELTVQKPIAAYLARPPLASARREHPRLRIGYLSGEFHGHAVMHLAAGVFERHDRSRFEVHAYSTGPAVRDPYRQRVEAGCEFFHDIGALGKLDAARVIADHDIDILVDLNGHTGNAKPAITAQRPAPVIVNWLGYPGTLGIPRLADYIIGDAVLTPLEHAAHYSETLAWMPHCYQPNDPDVAIAATPSRVEAGLPETGFVFASFNQPYKLTPQMFSLWCALLDAVPGSVLWLKTPQDPTAIDNLLREASARGIDARRLVFGPPLPMAEHVARMRLADLFLDTHPYGSGATGSTVLRAGVPMLTLMGESYVSRMAASQLHAVGLPELVTTSPEAYFELARCLARDPARLAALRERLAANLPDSPLFDTVRFTRDLERLYERIWDDHLHGVRRPITDL